MIGRISERVAELLHRAVQPTVEVDECVGRPELLPNLVSRDHLVAARDQETEDLERLIGKPYRLSVAAQLTRLQIEMEIADPDNALGD